MEAEAETFKSKAVSCEVDRNTETVIVFFLHGWDFRNAGIYFPRKFSPIKPYMYICICSWALGTCENIGIRTYFRPVTVESVGGFRHFALWRHGFQLATFFITLKNCIFSGASFKLIENLATLNPEKLEGFHGSPLCLCCTLALFVSVSVCVE